MEMISREPSRRWSLLMVLFICKAEQESILSSQDSFFSFELV